MNKTNPEKLNKTALITGGSRGIGLGIAQELAGKGYRIAINGIRPEHLVSEALNQLMGFGTEVIYCQGDIASPEDRKNIIEKVLDSFGSSHVLVNNAGRAPRERRDLLDMTEESYDQIMNTNLKGPLFLSQSVATWMIKQKKNDPKFTGCIINISSISATVASVNRAEYCISKAGLGMMTSLFATRLAEHNIPVYEIRPGIIDTDMTAGVKAKYDSLIESGLTLEKRWGKPADVGKAVAVLASGDLPYATGQVLMIDGGLTIQRL